jgi:hypothetical protein
MSSKKAEEAIARALTARSNASPRKGDLPLFKDSAREGDAELAGDAGSPDGVGMGLDRVAEEDEKGDAAAP